MVAARRALPLLVVAGVWSCAAPDPAADPGVIEVAAAHAARIEAATRAVDGYLAEVRRLVPDLAVSDTRLVEAAGYTCAAHGQVRGAGVPAERVDAAAAGLFTAGYLPRGTSWRAARLVVLAAGALCGSR